MKMPLRPTDDGWFQWTDAPPGADIFVKIDQAPDGRYRIVGLTMTGQLSAERLRSLPVGRIEAAANALLHGDTARPGARSRARIADSLRSNAVQGYPDSFYDAVAAAYHGLVGSSSRPIADLATANDVPLTTAQRWVKEARRRGKLPPGRPGKSG